MPLVVPVLCVVVSPEKVGQIANFRGTSVGLGLAASQVTVPVKIGFPVPVVNKFNRFVSSIPPRIDTIQLKPLAVFVVPVLLIFGNTLSPPLLLASAYTWSPSPICLTLFVQELRRAASRADCTAGNKRPTSVPMMAITTSSSTSVKPRRFAERLEQKRFIKHLP